MTASPLLSTLAEAFSAHGYDRHPVRRQAMDLLEQKGLPGAKSEEYRFTPVVKTLEKHRFTVPSSVMPTSLPSLDLVPNLACNRVVFVDGRYAAEHSRLMDDRLTVQPAEGTHPLAEQDPFDLLNQAFAPERIELLIPDGHALKFPIAIVYSFSQSSFCFANPRWSLRLGAGSKASVLEYTVAPPDATYFNNKQSRIEVHHNARLDLLTIQQGSREEVLVNNTTVWMAGSAQAFCYTATLDGKLVRNNLTLVLDGEGIDAHLHGLYLVSGQSLADNHTVVDHRKPNSFSNELYKGVVDEQGKAVFNGKIFVRPDAQKTNAFQSNRNILLSETSNIHTKPQLEIWADDVKCSHGCTTGQLDEEALFYLRSRGIPKDAAKGLLLTAFAGETLEGIHDETLRAFMEELILKKLHATHA